MPVMLERWNDDKMDALDAKVNGLDVKVGVLDTKVDVLAAELREQRREMKAGFEKVDGRIDRLYQALIGAAAVIAAAIVTAPHF